MKRLMILLVALLLTASAALAESWTADARTERFTAQSFGTQLPEDLRAALAATPFAGDAVRCGVVVERSRIKTGDVELAVTLFALEHGDHTVLMNGAREAGAAWRLWPAADERFLRPGEAFGIGVHVARYANGEVGVMLPAVTYGNEVFAVNTGDGITNLYAYACIDAEGTGVEIRPSYPDGDYAFIRWEKGQRVASRTCQAARSRRLEHLSAADFPRTEAELLAWQQAYPLSEEGTYVFAAHLRKEPTGKSRSLGQYRFAAATVLDSVPGTQLPWYQVRIGDTVGWVSGPYVVTESTNANHQLAQLTVPEFLCSDGELLLCALPGAPEATPLPAGTRAQILAECDGWYHVIVPEKATALLATDGLYGYVRVDAAPVYASEIALEYGMK